MMALPSQRSPAEYLGPVMQNIMRVFSVVLLIMVGTVFAVGPAGLIVTLCKNSGMSGVLTTTLFWLIIILVYYFIATFISIDAIIIGKIYPRVRHLPDHHGSGRYLCIFTNPAYTIPRSGQTSAICTLQHSHLGIFHHRCLWCNLTSTPPQSPLMAAA